MSYGHALGPASIPFEVSNLAGWLATRGVPEREALKWLSGATHLPLPDSRNELHTRGLSPQALKIEAERGRREGVDTLFAGIELVEIPGVSYLDPAQIALDLRAFREAGSDGLVLSWDLWHIPLERLDTVRAIWMQ